MYPIFFIHLFIDEYLGIFHVLSLVNNEREKNNLKPLEIDSKLQNLARLKAEDLVIYKYITSDRLKTKTKTPPARCHFTPLHD